MPAVYLVVYFSTYTSLLYWAERCHMVPGQTPERQTPERQTPERQTPERQTPDETNS